MNSLIKCSILIFMQAISFNQLRYCINSTIWLFIFVNISGGTIIVLVFLGYCDTDRYFFFGGGGYCGIHRYFLGYTKNRWYFLAAINVGPM